MQHCNAGNGPGDEANCKVQCVTYLTDQSCSQDQLTHIVLLTFASSSADSNVPTVSMLEATTGIP